MRRLLYSLIIGLLLIPNTVFADSLLPRFMGGIDPGVPAQVSITGIMNNPAVIGKLSGTNIGLYFSPVFQSLEAQRASISQTTGVPGPGADKSFGNVSYSNDIYDYFIGITSDLGLSRVTMGLAVYSPFRQYIVKPAAPLRYHLIDREFFNLFVTPVVSIKLHRKFYLGFGLSYIYSKVDMGNVRDRYLRGSLPDTIEAGYERGGIADEKVVISTSDSNFAFNVGSLYEIKKWLFLGVAYKSKIRGWNQTAVKTGGTGSITRYFDDGYKTLNGNANMETTFPDSLSAGLNMKLNQDWWTDFTLTWTRWSSHKSLKIMLSGKDFTNSSLTNWDLNITDYRGFQDTFSPQLTFFFDRKTGFKFSTSVRYNPPATPSQWVNATAVDNHSLDLLLSSTFRIANFVNFRVSYGFEYMLPITVSDSGYDPRLATECLSSHIDVVWSSACRATYSGQALPTSAATYKKLTHTIGVGLDFKF
jgi:long-subunit fatty acid transport protein